MSSSLKSSWERLARGAGTFLQTQHGWQQGEWSEDVGTRLGSGTGHAGLGLMQLEWPQSLQAYCWPSPPPTWQDSRLKYKRRPTDHSVHIEWLWITPTNCWITLSSGLDKNPPQNNQEDQVPGGILKLLRAPPQNIAPWGELLTPGHQPSAWPSRFLSVLHPCGHWPIHSSSCVPHKQLSLGPPWSLGVCISATRSAPLPKRGPERPFRPPLGQELWCHRNPKHRRGTQAWDGHMPSIYLTLMGGSEAKAEWGSLKCTTQDTWYSWSSPDLGPPGLLPRPPRWSWGRQPGSPGFEPWLCSSWAVQSWVKHLSSPGLLFYQRGYLTTHLIETARGSQEGTMWQGHQGLTGTMLSPGWTDRAWGTQPSLSHLSAVE